MEYRKKIYSEESTTISRQQESGEFVNIKIEVGSIYINDPIKPSTVKDRKNKGRIVEVLGFNDNFSPTGAIVKYLDNNRRGMVSPCDLVPYTEENIYERDSKNVHRNRTMISSGKNYVEVFANQLQILIQGPSEVFGGAELQLKAILSLLNIDFKYLEDDPNVLNKYFLAMLDRLGQAMQNNDFTVDDEGPTLVCVRNYLNRVIENNIQDDSEISAFIDSFSEDDE